MPCRRHLRSRTRKFLAACVLTLAPLFSPDAARAAGSRHWTAYVGTYTRRSSKGVYAFDFDADAGTLAPLGLAAETKTPSFLALSSDGRYLYVENELTKTSGGEGPEGLGWICAYALVPGDFRLKFINRVSSGGEGPAHIAVDRENRWVYAAHYNSGSVAAFPVRPDGGLGPLGVLIRGQPSDIHVGERRQQGPHAHCVVLDPAERFLYSCDFGADRVMVFRVGGPRAQLERADPPFATEPRGSGPRHIVLSPRTGRAYVANELGSTVCVFDWNEGEGRLALVQTVSTLPPGWTGTSRAAELQLSPDGRFLYVSNRGHDSIALFAVGPDGRLALKDTYPCLGRTPRFFTFDPTNAFLLVGDEDSERIRTFRVDHATGALSPVPGEASVSMPACIVFVPR
jgi:6-phosphogluconolactonase